MYDVTVQICAWLSDTTLIDARSLLSDSVGRASLRSDTAALRFCGTVRQAPRTWDVLACEA